MKSKHDYKTGDRVVLRTWKDMEEEYGLTPRDSVAVPGLFPKYMEDVLAGTNREVTLGRQTKNGWFEAKLPIHGKLFVSPHMIQGPASSNNPKPSVGPAKVNPRSQAGIVLAHLRSIDQHRNGEKRSISPAEAQALYGVWRLADVIYKLKGKGYNIRTEVRQARNGKRYARYWLAGE